MNQGRKSVYDFVNPFVYQLLNFGFVDSGKNCSSVVKLRKDFLHTSHESGGGCIALIAAAEFILFEVSVFRMNQNSAEFTGRKTGTGVYFFIYNNSAAYACTVGKAEKVIVFSPCSKSGFTESRCIDIIFYGNRDAEFAGKDSTDVSACITGDIGICIADYSFSESTCPAVLIPILSKAL